jgi:hypothetical protein
LPREQIALLPASEVLYLRDLSTPAPHAVVLTVTSAMVTLVGSTLSFSIPGTVFEPNKGVAPALSCFLVAVSLRCVNRAEYMLELVDSTIKSTNGATLVRNRLVSCLSPPPADFG